MDNFWKFLLRIFAEACTESSQSLVLLIKKEKSPEEGYVVLFPSSFNLVKEDESAVAIVLLRES